MEPEDAGRSWEDEEEEEAAAAGAPRTGGSRVQGPAAAVLGASGSGGCTLDPGPCRGGGAIISDGPSKLEGFGGGGGAACEGLASFGGGGGAACEGLASLCPFVWSDWGAS